jgi:hypothetical protein
MGGSDGHAVVSADDERLPARLPDASDLATAAEEAHRRQAIERRRPEPRSSYTGHCHWCGEITGGGRRFCDTDCRNDWGKFNEKQ